MEFKSGFYKAAVAYVRYVTPEFVIAAAAKTSPIAHLQTGQPESDNLLHAVMEECDCITYYDIHQVIEYLAHAELHGWLNP